MFRPHTGIPRMNCPFCDNSFVRVRVWGFLVVCEYSATKINKIIGIYKKKVQKSKKHADNSEEMTIFAD